MLYTYETTKRRMGLMKFVERVALRMGHFPATETSSSLQLFVKHEMLFYISVACGVQMLWMSSLQEDGFPVFGMTVIVSLSYAVAFLTNQYFTDLCGKIRGTIFACLIIFMLLLPHGPIYQSMLGVAGVSMIGIQILAGVVFFAAHLTPKSMWEPLETSITARQVNV